MKNIGKTLCLLSCMALTAQAQRTPDHPLDIKMVTTDNLDKFFDQWMTSQSHPNGLEAIDDEFFVSRTRPLPRIAEGDYQVNPNAKAGRKMLMWVPMDDPTSSWKTLPRYCFEGDNFSMWSYINIHGNWTAPWVRVTGGISDVAAKNGVTVGCVLSTPWNSNIRIPGYYDHSAIITAISKERTQGSNDFLYAAPLVKMMKYYGINGIGWNSEFNSDRRTMDHIRRFFKACHKEAEKIGWKFEVHWYDGTDDNGNISFDRGLGGHNAQMFGNKDNIVTDAMFANYNWGERAVLGKSVQKAKELGRNSFDYYAGFDIQGRGLTNLSWGTLSNHDISIGFWGAHSQSLLHQSATDDGTSDIAIQKAYLKKQELVFSGGNHNPAVLPAINTGCGLGNSSLEGQHGFHGLATFLTAKSTIQQVPFVSRFNLGNGLSFRNEGKVTFNHKWYNLTTQDYMPTWRWWITNTADQATVADLPKFVKAELSFDDAYFGGSCLSLSGASPFSRVKLFKTMLEVQPDYEFSLVYKTMKGTETHAKFFVALSDNVKSYKEVALPATANEGEWATFKVKASALGLKAGDKVAMMGLALENTPADYRMHVGEMALRDLNKKFTPVAPKIKQVQVLRGRFNACDYKMLYSADEKDNWDHKVYNDDVDTWYYEIFFQQKGQPEQLLTATTTWAAYVVDAPMIPGMENRECRFGVRAVSPDGIQKSDISWTAYQTVAYDSPSNEIVCDKPVVKPGEEFTLSYFDTMSPAAQEWKIVDPVTEKVVASAKNSLHCTAKIEKEGLYDLCVINASGLEDWIRGKVNISPEATGSVPQITSLTADKQTAAAGEEVILTYEGRMGEGTVSRALVISDPKMFMIPGEVQKGYDYSYALWFKANNFAHDKQGTNLINKNSIADKWPHNNWGDLWVTIRPQWKNHAANEVSFNTMGWTAHDNPNEKVMTTDYSITPGVWNHLVITHDSKKNQKIYLNGKLLGQDRFVASTRREDYGDYRINANEVANIFIGGGGVYKAGFNGLIDEVQVWNKALTDEEVLQAMKGYKEGEVPEALQAYYTFEKMEADQTFKNLGHATCEATGKVVAMEGSGGEGTDKAAYVKKDANNDNLGVPSIPGSMQITGEAKWNVPTGNIQKEEGKTAVFTFTTAGKKNATLTLTNGWGSVLKELPEFVEITVTDGIDEVASGTEMSVFPNPFVESVNLRFAQGGDYTVRVLGSTGSLLQQNTFSVAGGDQVNVAIQGAPGLYLLQVLQGNRLVKTLKVLKK